MSQARLPLRLILLAALAIAAVFAIGLVVTTLNGLLELIERISAQPLWLRVPLIAFAAALLAAIGWTLWRLARPARTPALSNAVAPASRIQVEQRIDALRDRQADTAALEAELAELDRRRDSGELHVALFGEISSGKSSLLRALAPQTHVDIDVRGGTTQQVSHHRGELRSGRSLVLADVPGSGEVDGALHEQIARDEALRAHAVLYLTAADLTRNQDSEIQWLASFGKPMLLVLNKVDQYDDAQRDALLARFHERYAARTQSILAISAGGSERHERLLADGRRERVERERRAEIEPLRDALEQIATRGPQALEPAREAAVLAEVGRRGDRIARETAARESTEAIGKYTRRAVVGALAAVAPGTDLLIQGALATGLVRELARIHGIAVREIDVDALLARIGLTIRSTSALVLAIAGNALKAFPGLGTLGGGMLHAIAYGLVFDSLGHALAATLAERATLDPDDIETRLRALLTAPPRERIERITRIAVDGARGALHREDSTG